MTPPQKPSRPFAVVDIGSNSVRLVVFDVSARKPEVLWQKKVRCGLARGLRHDCLSLDPRAAALTLKTLARFRVLLKKKNIEDVCAVGTAALRLVRRTPRGKAFRRRAEAALGNKIAVISGKREAALGAKGVCLAWPKATGICGDLGGGSLELSLVKKGRIVRVASLPLGILTLMAEANADPAKASLLLRSRLKKLAWLAENSSVLYLVGGSWRTVARVMRKKSHNPPGPVHGYAVPAATAAPALKAMAQAKSAAFRAMGRKIRRRAKYIPIAAMALGALLALMQPRRIVFSSFGLREGILREKRKLTAAKRLNS